MIWIANELSDNGYSQQRTNAFLKEFGAMDLTASLLKTWMNKRNCNSEQLVQEMKQKLKLNQISMIWDVVSAAIVELVTEKRDR